MRMINQNIFNNKLLICVKIFLYVLSFQLLWVLRLPAEDDEVFGANTPHPGHTDCLTSEELEQIWVASHITQTSQTSHGVTGSGMTGHTKPRRGFLSP